MEVGALLHRFNTEFDDFSPGAEVLSTRVREHIELDHSLFLLAGQREVGVAQLRFRDSLWSGALSNSLGFSNLEKDGKPETQMLCYERDL